jgi:hypothetical protein
MIDDWDQLVHLHFKMRCHSCLSYIFFLAASTICNLPSDARNLVLSKAIRFGWAQHISPVGAIDEGWPRSVKFLHKVAVAKMGIITALTVPATPASLTISWTLPFKNFVHRYSSISVTLQMMMKVLSELS